MPHRMITRMLIEDNKYPSACQPLIDELTSAYNQHDSVMRRLRAAELEAEIASGVSVEAKSRYEALALALEREYAALVEQLRREDAVIAAEVEARLAPMNHIRELLDLAGIEAGEREDVRLMRVLRLLTELEKQVRFDKQYIELLQAQLYGKRDRHPTPPPGSTAPDVPPPDTEH